MGIRRQARECALEMLYQFEVGKYTEDDLLELMAAFWRQRTEDREEERMPQDEKLLQDLIAFSEQLVYFGKFFELWQTGHAAIFVHNFTQHPHRLQISQLAKINRSFGVSGTK